MHIADDLWLRISEYSPDDPGARISFSDRLRRENDWSRVYTRRVVEEYKRFIYLVCAAGCEVTPSEDVDTVWHLHLVHTRSYWDDLCGEVLRRKVHHGPTKGGQIERKRFGSCYEDTLASYVKIFGETPPRDIWPPQTERFAKTGRMRWIDTGTHWVIRKPDFVFLKRLKWQRGAVVLGVATLAGTGASAATQAKQADPFAAIALVVSLIFLGWQGIRWLIMSPEERAAERAKKKGGDGGCSSGCSSSDSSSDSGGCGSGSGCGGGSSD